MKTQTITYSYDPAARSLTMIIDGKPRGGFMGPVAEQKFYELLLTDAQINITNMNTVEYKKSLIRRFHACLANQGIMKHKQDILSRYGKEHTTDLSTEELKDLVDEFTAPGISQAKQATARVRSLRSDILTILNKMGVYVTNNDWTRVNAYLMDKRIAGKMLWQIEEPGLIELRKKLNSILTKEMNASTEIDRQKLMN